MNTRGHGNASLEISDGGSLKARRSDHARSGFSPPLFRPRDVKFYARHGGGLLPAMETDRACIILHGGRHLTNRTQERLSEFRRGV